MYWKTNRRRGEGGGFKGAIKSKLYKSHLESTLNLRTKIQLSSPLGVGEEICEKQIKIIRKTDQKTTFLKLRCDAITLKNWGLQKVYLYFNYLIHFVRGIGEEIPLFKIKNGKTHISPPKLTWEADFWTSYTTLDYLSIGSKMYIYAFLFLQHSLH